MTGDKVERPSDAEVLREAVEWAVDLAHCRWLSDKRHEAATTPRALLARPDADSWGE